MVHSIGARPGRSNGMDGMGIGGRVGGDEVAVIGNYRAWAEITERRCRASLGCGRPDLGGWVTCSGLAGSEQI